MPSDWRPFSQFFLNLFLGSGCSEVRGRKGEGWCGVGVLQKRSRFNFPSPCHQQPASDSSGMSAAIMRNSSKATLSAFSSRCSDKPQGSARQRRWERRRGGRREEGDWVPRVALLPFNKCHSGAVVSTAQAGCNSCAVYPRASVWKTVRTRFLFLVFFFSLYSCSFRGEKSN